MAQQGTAMMNKAAHGAAQGQHRGYLPIIVSNVWFCSRSQCSSSGVILALPQRASERCAWVGGAHVHDCHRVAELEHHRLV